MLREASFFTPLEIYLNRKAKKSLTGFFPLDLNVKRRKIKKGLMGFTLIEFAILTVVLSVLAIALIVSTGSNELAGSVNKLMFDLRYAQQLAISRGVSCGISFDPSGNSYFVYIGDIATKATDPYTKGEFIVDYDEYRGINLVSTNFGDLISFDYIGTPYDSLAIVLSSEGIIILADASTTKSVTIQPNTGKVKIP